MEVSLSKAQGQFVHDVLSVPKFQLSSFKRDRLDKVTA
jgi:hypothetical protein